MIALLSGELAYKAPDHIIVNVGGVGYQLTIPLSSFYSLPEKGNVSLHVHTHVREDALQLFGFLSREEKEMFGLLIGVSGVGPKVAVNILSNCTVPELKQALMEGNLKRLSSIPGIGKKSAERLILELREKVGKLDPGVLPPAVNMPAAGISLEDALSALTNLGYKETLARKALQSIEISPEATLEEVLPAALKHLTR